jgi:hypothetical protein
MRGGSSLSPLDGYEKYPDYIERWPKVTWEKATSQGTSTNISISNGETKYQKQQQSNNSSSTVK